MYYFKYVFIRLATIDDFKSLMNRLNNETDKVQKASLGTSLTELLLMPNGFNSYYEYVSTVSDDRIECINIFCKVALTRSLKFSNDIVTNERLPDMT